MTEQLGLASERRTAFHGPSSAIPSASLSRRALLGGAAALTVGLVLPWRARAEAAATGGARAALEAAKTSALIYVSPLKRDGSESRCHGEVWFVEDGDALLVVTDPERWRASAIAKGLDRARIWVGDFGVWKDSKGRFRSAPGFDARAVVDGDRGVHARALAAFGRKYPDEWDKWGPRFEKGLASGERVLIRYSPAS
jgi:hypothetical protein